MKKLLTIALVLLLCLPMLIPFMARADSGALSIETTRIYSGMDKSYSQGYVPTIKDGIATIVLPLVGSVDDNIITVTPQFEAEASPFVYANYRFNVKNDNGVYLIKLDLKLKDDRKNGVYPVTFNIEYAKKATTSDEVDTEVQQTFTVYVNITDGKVVDSPDLFITDYKLSNKKISGGKTFEVTVKIKNIGGEAAKAVKLTYDGQQSENGKSLIPATNINTMLIGDIEPSETKSVSFKMKSDKNALAGRTGFTVNLEYKSEMGEPIQVERTLYINITQPLQITVDKIEFPESVESGESITIPISILNTGKSAIADVTCKLDAEGLFGSSLYIGEVLAGTTGMGEMKIFIGTVGDILYGFTRGTLTITYKDLEGKEYTEEVEVETDIMEPATEANAEGQGDIQQQPEQKKSNIQWYASVIAGLGVIAITVAVIVVVEFNRRVKLK